MDNIILDYYAELEADIFDKGISKSYDLMLKDLVKKEKVLAKEERAFKKHCKQQNLERGSEEWVLHYEFFGDLIELQVQTDDIRHRLSSIGEMRIIYLYKTVEGSIRGMLKTSQNIEKYNWNKEGEIDQLKSIGIDTKSLDGYSNINTLRLVNNTIKHSEDLPDALNSKFNNYFPNTHSYQDFEDFTSFYNNIFPACPVFLQSLKNELLSKFGS